MTTNTFSQTDIFDVCRTGSLEDIKAIYNTKPESINTYNDMGFLPLTIACYNGNKAIVEFLARKVENINGNSKYGTPLMGAVVKGHTDIVKILIDNNAETDVQDSKGETAAHYAVMFKKYDIIKLLVESKADFNIKNAKDEMAIDYAKLHNDPQIIKLLNL